jgi:large subunit ribosomal protein L15
MASKRPLQSLLSTASSSLRPAQISRTSFVRSSACAFSSTTPSRATEYDAETVDRPRWKQTPPRMMAPHRIRPKPRGGVFQVNEDPKKLDDAYIRMLGPGGDKMLGDDVKWLAVTHKSFDHGRRGFNDRLAYLGMCAQCQSGRMAG